MLFEVYQWWIRFGFSFSEAAPRPHKDRPDCSYEKFLQNPVMVQEALTTWFQECSDLPKQEEDEFVAHFCKCAKASTFLLEVFQWWSSIGYMYSPRREDEEEGISCTYEQFLRDSDMVSRALVTWFREMSDQEPHEEAHFEQHFSQCAAAMAS
jgi:2-oxoglutarate dehydrogenase complex dehydrogenase (E1) component-like enzyme